MMRSLLKGVMAFALTFIASVLLVATINGVTLNSDKMQDISPVSCQQKRLVRVVCTAVTTGALRLFL